MTTRFTFERDKPINEGLLSEETCVALNRRLGCLYITETHVNFDVEESVAGDKAVVTAVLDAHDADGESQAEIDAQYQERSKMEVNAADLDALQKMAIAAKDLAALIAVVNDVILIVGRLAEAVGMTPVTPAAEVEP